MFQFIKVGVAVPNVEVGNCSFNQTEILEKIQIAEEKGVHVLAFPELSITGYTCADLFFQKTLQQASETALSEIVKASASNNILIAIGMPILIENQLFSAAVILLQGKILGVVPKTYLPNYSEFYEKRWFSSGLDLKAKSFTLLNQEVPIGLDLLFEIEDYVKVGVEICEDLWSPIPPSSALCLAGADVILNLSASNETVAKRDYRRSLVLQQSARSICAYVYSSAGGTESTTDLVFSGHGLIAENGVLLKENKKLVDTDYLITSHIDVERLRAERIKCKSYADTNRLYFREIRCIKANVKLKDKGNLEYPLVRKPFVPQDLLIRDSRCKEIMALQVAGLSKRLKHTNAKSVVVGISGGLDSTLALLVSTQAFDVLGLDRKGILGITMPGFGTTDRTFENSMALMKSLGVSTKVIPIKDACMQHFKDIEHNITQYDVTYENTQARERTQMLMDIANKHCGFVVGTGDLSELALGWCTYNADHMSMYGVNSSIPKTLVKSLVLSFANDQDEITKNVLLDILDTPVSPELLPTGKNGEMLQKTEDTVGPYELHDFFLYYVLRYGFSPDKILYLATRVFEIKELPEDVVYDEATILKWLKVFYKRFFSQQFKRNCMPDGPKVGSICLSPRGDWRMPSDASVNEWLKRLD